MRKHISLLISSIIIISTLLSGCAKESTNSSTDGKFKIVTTIFPAYDWIRELTNNTSDTQVSLLGNDQTDLHNFQPSADDIINISNADMFIYVGGESDEWIDAVLSQKANENMIVINLMDTITDSLKEEVIVEGMQSEDEEEEADEIEYDEHIWLSLRNAEVIVNSLSDKLSILCPANKDIYASNCDNYTSQLEALDQEYLSFIDNANCKTLVFADRFPFRYLTDDYNLSYYAAFSGCSAESEASFETIVFLAGKLNELHLKNILIIENSNKDIANSVIESSDNQDTNILILNSMQSLSADDISSNTYLGIMKANLDIIKSALTI